MSEIGGSDQRAIHTNKVVVVSTAPLLDGASVVGMTDGAEACAGSGTGSSRNGLVEIGRGLVWPVASLLRKGLFEANGELTRSERSYELAVAQAQAGWMGYVQESVTKRTVRSTNVYPGL